MECKRVLKANGTRSKKDKNSITFQLWNGKFIGLLPQSLPSQDLKYGLNIAAKKNH